MLEVSNIPYVRLSTFIPTKRRCTPFSLCFCVDGKELGDFNNDCVFDVIDVLGMCDRESDMSQASPCNQKDFLYYLDAAFFRFPLVVSSSSSGVALSDCYLVVGLELAYRGQRPVADSDVTSVMLLSHQDALFQEQFDESVIHDLAGRKTIVSGSISEGISFGGVVLSHSGSGMFVTQLNSALTVGQMGVSFLVISGEWGTLSLFGDDAIPQRFPEATTLSVLPSNQGSEGVTLPLGFNPFLNIFSDLSTSDCINNSPPVFDPSYIEIHLIEQTLDASSKLNFTR